MQKNIVKIRPATIDDAPFIAQTVMGALGEELCVSLGGGKENLSAVRQLFTELAMSYNSQYSYRNALVAIDDKV